MTVRISDIHRECDLAERADEAARLVAFTLFPDLYPENNRAIGVPVIYSRIARIIIQAIEEGIV